MLARGRATGYTPRPGHGLGVPRSRGEGGRAPGDHEKPLLDQRCGEAGRRPERREGAVERREAGPARGEGEDLTRQDRERSGRDVEDGRLPRGVGGAAAGRRREADEAPGAALETPATLLGLAGEGALLV